MRRSYALSPSVTSRVPHGSLDVDARLGFRRTRPRSTLQVLPAQRFVGGTPYLYFQEPRKLLFPGAILAHLPYPPGADVGESMYPIPEGDGFYSSPTPPRFYKAIPINPTYYFEWPSPTEPCAYPDQNPDPPYLSQTGLDWTQQPYDLPLSISMFAPGHNDTRVLQARLVRLSNGQELPVCGYGSLQFWNQDAFARDWGKNILKGYSTVFVVPRYPLNPGEAYRAEVRAVFGSTEKTFTWSFRVAPQDGLFPLRLSP
jgi:hypothetical protein